MHSSQRQIKTKMSIEWVEQGTQGTTTPLYEGCQANSTRVPLFPPPMSWRAHGGYCSTVILH